MNEMLVFWLVVLIVSIAVEALTMGLTSIWFAGGALTAIAVTALKAPIAVQVIVFFVVALLLLIFTRPIAVKYFNKDRVKTNVESLMGRQAIVISEVDNLQGIGQVTVGGQEWSARSLDPDRKLDVGMVVNVVAIDGVKLIVEPDARIEEIQPVSNKENS